MSDLSWYDRRMKTFEVGVLSTLMADVAVTDDCWIWTGEVSDNGYGAFNSGMFRANAHRVMFVIMNDEEPEVVRHACGNPLCVKPTHLVAGTQQENMQDKFFHGTGGTQKLTVEDVRDIRRRFVRTSPRKSNSKELAREYGVRPQYISRIASGKALTYVG